MPSTVKLAEYIFTRLNQLGVQSVHGVPGDYNLPLLDYVTSTGLHWVGNCNELNAGYAADGYSRVKGLGALITTFGVGELSAINAIAGAYAELAPVVHIVGSPARQAQEERALIHHTLNDGDFDRFALMYEHVTIAQARLRAPSTAPALVDQTIRQCLIHSRPVYIEIPLDMVSVDVSAAGLEQKLELPPRVPSVDEAAALDLVLDKISASRRPLIIVDGESRAYGILDHVRELIRITGWPTWTSTFGKGLIDESLPNVHGIWKGKAATQQTQEFVAAADLILCFGPHFCSTNTYAYSGIPDPDKTILFKATTVETSTKAFRDLPSKQFLDALLPRLQPAKSSSFATFTVQHEKPPALDGDGAITQEHLYQHMNGFLRPGDIVLGETGTAGHGCRDFVLPAGAQLFKPSTWLSIGYMLPATQGAALAQRELESDGRWTSDSDQPARAVLLIGDGSFQMTVQELSTIIRERLNVTVFLINNAGYTIERYMHPSGFTEAYNDVGSWRYLQAASFFGAADTKEYPSHTFSAKTWAELDAVLGNSKLTDGPGFRMVEVSMDSGDAPATIKNT